MTGRALFRDIEDTDPSLKGVVRTEEGETFPTDVVRGGYLRR